MSDDTTNIDLASLQTQVEQEGLEQILSPPVPDDIRNWLARLTLLYGVPFENLVADSRMLPVESIRWYYMDANWLESLVDGAFSIGAHSDRDIRYHRVMQPVIREATDIAAGKLRKELQGRDAEQTIESDPDTRAGFLLRSATVSGWPGMEVVAYDQEPNPELDVYQQIKALENAARVDVLRMERLAPDVLLCIFAKIPRAVVINEPAEGLHFGASNDKVLLRSPEAGKLVDPEQSVKLGFRGDKEDRVLDIDELARRLGNAADLDGRTLGPADFAVQMVNAADKQLFTPTGVDEPQQED